MRAKECTQTPYKRCIAISICYLMISGGNTPIVTPLLEKDFRRAKKNYLNKFIYLFVTYQQENFRNSQFYIFEFTKKIDLIV